MPPGPLSRYLFTSGIKDADGNLFLTDRSPYRYQALDDNRFHTVVLGDTLHVLAEDYFGSFEAGARLWWVIADFQPEPILDPTVPLEVGRTLVIPSLRTVTEKIFNEERRE